MPSYTVKMFREVVTHDGYEVEIEADSLEAAEAKAEDMGSEMNGDCPDGVEETGFVECRGWQVRDVKPADAAIA